MHLVSKDIARFYLSYDSPPHSFIFVRSIQPFIYGTHSPVAEVYFARLHLEWTVGFRHVLLFTCCCSWSWNEERI